jgi:glutathione S-transferase
LVERSKRRVANFYSDMDERLAKVAFVAGENFTAADITTLVTVDFATRGLNMPVPPESRALRYWYDTVAARPGATA